MLLTKVETVIDAIFIAEKIGKLPIYFLREDEFITGHYVIPYSKIIEFKLVLKKYCNEDYILVNWNHDVFKNNNALIMLGVRLNKDETLNDVRVEIMHINTIDIQIRISKQLFEEVYPGLPVPPIIPFGIQLSGDYLYHAEDEEIKTYLTNLGKKFNYLDEPLHLISYNFETDRLKCYYLTDTLLIGLEPNGNELIRSEYKLLKKTL